MRTLMMTATLSYLHTLCTRSVRTRPSRPTPSQYVTSTGIQDLEVHRRRTTSLDSSGCRWDSLLLLAYAIRELRCIRPYLDFKTASTIATSIVHSKLDYCNSLYYNLPYYQLNRLQQIQNYCKVRGFDCGLGFSVVGACSKLS